MKLQNTCIQEYLCYNMSVKKRGTTKMSDKRFKQIRNYFYLIKDECIRLISACDNADKLTRYLRECLE